MHLHLTPHAKIKFKRFNIELQQYLQEEKNPYYNEYNLHNTSFLMILHM